MLNQFETRKIITMNLTVFHGTEIADLEHAGKFEQAGTQEKKKEIQRLLECLDVKKGVEFDTTHATNLMKIQGTLPQDRECLLNKIEEYLKE